MLAGVVHPWKDGVAGRYEGFRALRGGWRRGKMGYIVPVFPNGEVLPDNADAVIAALPACESLRYPVLGYSASYDGKAWSYTLDEGGL